MPEVSAPGPQPAPDLTAAEGRGCEPGLGRASAASGISSVSVFPLFQLSCCTQALREERGVREGATGSQESRGGPDRAPTFVTL